MSKKVLLAGVLPFISNPVVLAVVGIGAVGWTVYELFSNKEGEQDNGSETVPEDSTPLNETLDYEDWTVPATVIEPLKTVEATVEGTVHSTVEEPYTSRGFDNHDNTPKQDETINEEDLKKEVIRQAMSELGKRSAAVRAKKKSNS